MCPDQAGAATNMLNNLGESDQANHPVARHFTVQLMQNIVAVDL